jgi:hypothetical protein
LLLFCLRFPSAPNAIHITNEPLTLFVGFLCKFIFTSSPFIFFTLSLSRRLYITVMCTINFFFLYQNLCVCVIVQSFGSNLKIRNLFFFLCSSFFVSVFWTNKILPSHKTTNRPLNNKTKNKLIFLFGAFKLF